jgi:uncharacterized Zn finger protein
MVFRVPPTSIYRKGAELFHGGKVSLDAETENGVYLFVEGEHRRYEVRLMSGGSFNCTCALGSLKAGKPVICSHVVAAILFETSGERSARPSSLS